MTELIPYFSGAVTLSFGVAFYFGLQEFKKIEENKWLKEKWNFILINLADLASIAYSNVFS